MSFLLGFLKAVPREEGDYACVVDARPKDEDPKKTNQRNTDLYPVGDVDL